MLVLGFYLFQSHAGSIEAQISRLASIAFSQFQSHAGSIEACRQQKQLVNDLEFQSHAGSIEAGPLPPGAWAVWGVSIPRWFD